MNPARVYAENLDCNFPPVVQPRKRVFVIYSPQLLAQNVAEIIHEARVGGYGAGEVGQEDIGLLRLLYVPGER